MERAIAAVRERIEAACERAGRDPREVRLIGATKLVAPKAVRRAHLAGIGEFAENYVQELEAKREAAPQAIWHFIGRLQRNKARRVVEAADVVQTLERTPAVGRLASLAEARERTVPCLVEVDFTGRRVGVSPQEAEGFLIELQDLRGLDVRGLMTVAPPGDDPRAAFSALRRLRDRVRERFPDVVELSMGMSDDLDAAVEEGATMVRVGSAIFGPRPQGGNR